MLPEKKLRENTQEPTKTKKLQHPFKVDIVYEMPKIFSR